MEIRLSEPQDRPAILALYQSGRLFMREHGNLHQWTIGHPNEESLQEDLKFRRSFVVWDQGEIVGTFALVTHDPNYDGIEGRWLNDEPYVAVHRVVSGKPGAGSFLLNALCAQYPTVRIDTHQDNTPMKNLLTKLAFVHCGVIHLRDFDGSPREAYMKVSRL